MIPISERALFNGVISIKSTLTIEPSDTSRIDEFLKREFGFVEVNYQQTFTIDQKITFENSQRKRVSNTWGINFSGRKRKGRTPFKPLLDADWLKAADFVETLLPKVMYFPAALLEFPDRIYLENKSGLQPKKTPPVPTVNSFYYQVLADVLKAVNPELDIEKHILSRAKSENKSARQNLDAVILKVEAHLNQTVLGEWKNTLGATLGAKSFRFFVKTDESGLVYAEIKLFDGKSLFSLNERSAGFRWFFAFIMLVKYRVHRNDRVLFLFDEPAANLHPKAQAALLKSFSSLSKNHQFLYTTHSHYLVNPHWLESTFIVKNEAIDSERNFVDSDPEASRITITPYRSFVGSHPDQYFYYKPVMDALEYTPPQISPERSSILIEGKTDYYCLEYFKQIYFPDEFNLTLFPGGGSGSLDPLISLLSGWAINFLVLLDGDASGKQERARYEEKFESLVADRIQTIGDFLNTKDKIRIEDLFDSGDIELIRSSLFESEKSLSKKLLHRGIQELLANRRRLPFSTKTTTRFHSLLKGLDDQYAAMELLG